MAPSAAFDKFISTQLAGASRLDSPRLSYVFPTRAIGRSEPRRAPDHLDRDELTGRCTSLWPEARPRPLGSMMVSRIGEGESLLWVHGLGESSLCFQRVVRELPQYKHWLVDLPGYGRAPWEPAYSLEAAALSLVEILELVGPCLVIGHSMGGVIGTLLCERFPERVRAFINVDGNISLGDCGYSRPISSQSLPSFIRSGHQELLDELYQIGQSDQAHRGYYVSMNMACPQTVYLHSQQLVQLSKSEKMAQRMAALSLPNAYIAGAPDGAAPRSLELLKEAGVRLEKVQPSGHWPFIDQPESFAEMVSVFRASF